MPDYTFRSRRTGKKFVMRSTISSYDDLLATAKMMDWERVIDLPAGVIIQRSLGEYMEESTREAEELDRQGWPGMS